MERALRDKWTAALRSGEYQQGLSYLKAKDADGTFKYCCLGVLCEIAGHEAMLDNSSALVSFLTKYTYDDSETDPEYFAGADDNREACTASLSQNMQAELGIDRQHHARLIDMNDDEGKNFHQIADYIEENL